MGRNEGNQRNRSEQDTAPLDPVALTLALWLGFMVIVTGLVRFSENAVANARMLQAQQSAQVQPTMVVRPRLPYAPYGG